LFVHTSNMTYWKRLDLLIDAFAAVRHDHEARLLIVGEGPQRSHAAEQIRQLGLSADAETAGWVEDPLQFAARAWAFVLPSDEEGFAQVLTEAISADCPVVTTDAHGVVLASSRTTVSTVFLSPEEIGRSLPRPWRTCCRQMYANDTQSWVSSGSRAYSTHLQEESPRVRHALTSSIRYPSPHSCQWKPAPRRKLRWRGTCQSELYTPFPAIYLPRIACAQKVCARAVCDAWPSSKATELARVSS
jgi:hypothetical protein